jgi:AcrR family transcriptional regulator
MIRYWPICVIFRAKSTLIRLFLLAAMPRPKGRTLTPQDILDVAIVLLETQGVAEFSINQLARALAIKPPSLYNHFAGDDALRRSIRLEGWKRIAECLPEIQSNDHPVDLMRRTAQSYREFAIENPALYLFTVQHPFPLEDWEFTLVLDRIFELFITMLTPFGLGTEETLHGARMLYATIQGLLLNELLGTFNTEAEVSFERAIDRSIANFVPAH